MWILPSSILSAFALASECSTSDLNLPASGKESESGLWVTASGKPRRQASSWRGWKKKAWSQRLFGQAIWRESQQKNFVAWWTSSGGASHASHSAKPGNGKERGMTDGYGQRSGSSPKKAVPGSSSLKMSAGLFVLAWNPSCMTLPKLGGLRNGVIYERRMLALPMAATESSSWPTIRASDGEKGGPNQRDSSGNPSLNMATSHWQSPATDSFRSRGGDRRNEMGLDQQARNHWKTPHGLTGAQGQGGGEFDKQARNWGTPRVTTNNGIPSPQCTGKGSRLEDQAGTWPTPKAMTGGPNCNRENRPGTGGPDLQEMVEKEWSLRRVLEATSGEELSPTRRILRPRLNPRFVCWLMGWPTWWTYPDLTNFGQEETALWRSKLRSHMRFYLKG
jgi:hypothetical protein